MSQAALIRLGKWLRGAGYHFITPTPLTHARVNARPNNQWARGIEDVFGWSRPFRIEVLPQGLIDAMQEAGVLVETDTGSWRSSVRLSTLGDLLILHSAYPTVAADAVFFGPDTYRYADALSAWLDGNVPVNRAVDIGCGAGPGALIIAHARPAAEVFGVDINKAALQMTQVNAELATQRVVARQSDLLSNIDGQFDLIVSNPPYLADPAERAYRHGGGTLGADLSLMIVETALERLAPGGSLLLYTGVAIVNGKDEFRAKAGELINSHGVVWRYREVDPDVFGEELDHEPYQATDRIAAVVLTATKAR